MTRAELLLALLLAVATMLIVVPARGAESTRVAIATLCPGNDHLAGFVDEAAHRCLLHPVVLVAVMRVESHCRMGAVGKARREACAMQLHGRARNGLTREQLSDPATCIYTGARWLSLMTTWAGSLPAGLGAYNTGKRGRGQRYARKVLGFIAQVRRAIQQRTEPRS